MKNRIVIYGLLLVLVLMVWLFWPKHQTMQRLPAIETNAVITLTPTQQVSKTVDPLWTNTDRLPTPEEFQKLKPELERRRRALAEKADNEWRTPIDFYGRVLDESNNPIADASVHFVWNDISIKGTAEADTKSDVAGHFSLTGKSGKAMTVYVSKDGYYEYVPSGMAFNYAGENQNFVPDAGNPVVFRLRKKGEGADLIHYDKSFKLSTDGTPILIDLPSGEITVSSQNAIKVEIWIYERIDRWKFNWRCRVSVPGGGLQIYDEEFPFLAPEDNYVPKEVIDMPLTNNPSWSNQAHRNYYIRTAEGKFARMVFMMIPDGDRFCELHLYFNPTGSRNLELKN